MDRFAEELAAWQQDLFDEVPPKHESAAELPRLLSVVYKNPGVRDMIADNGLLHLYGPAEVKWDDDVLIFACESQGICEWGIRKGDSFDQNPSLVANMTGGWEDDGCDLLSFLKLYIALNRTSKTPCTEALSSEQGESLSDARALREAWEPLSASFRSLDWTCTIWKKGGAVAVVEGYGKEPVKNCDVALGARTEAEFSAAVQALVGD